MAIHLLTQDRKILAKSTPIYLARDSPMHPIICATLRSAPIYSQRALERESVAAAVSAAKL